MGPMLDPGRRPAPDRRVRALCAIFFLGGAAALIFETIWFRQAGLLLGNTVWTSALVTASFMAGLAIGNAAAARTGWRLARPLRAYAALEVTVAVTGVALAAAIPRLVPVLAPALAALGSRELLDAARVAAAFLLLAVPSSAMGATLPILARALSPSGSDFGRALGRLYGWNTLGAVAGALAGEAVLIRAFGVAGSGAAAAALNLTAALGALALDRRWPAVPGEAPSRPARTGRMARLAVAALLAGGLLLALEIVWFRFLLLFVNGTSIAFAVMLAVVLAGIALGGLLAPGLLDRWPPERVAPAAALAAGAAVVFGYATLVDVAARLPNPAPHWWGTAVLASWLMLPACVASGIVFVALGKSLHADVAEGAAAAGRLTLANTVGAMCGALAGGFALLPLLGIERSLFGLSAAYAAVALTVPGAWRGPRPASVAAAAVFAGALALFPFGSMAGSYAEHVRVKYGRDTAVLAGWRESLTETVFIFRYDSLGAPKSWRLATNRVSMATTSFPSRRYMGLYAWWPVAVHPAPRRALLISYGLGTTARALVETRELERIDVVDVSAAVLEMSAMVWPDPSANPLRDPRVRVHVEDGRFHLQTTGEAYDLITGEPPPPKMAGMVSLYTREYFALMKERLAPGGIVTYWLPVLQLRPREAFAVMRAFCDVFEDCSLWSGYGHEWMLAGTRGLAGGVSEDRFARQWDDPRVAELVREAGLDTPAHLGATFLADAPLLRALTRGVEPVVDDRPYRLDPAATGVWPSEEYHLLMKADAARTRFAGSAFVRRLWPERWLRATLPHFESQDILNRIAWFAEAVAAPPPLEDVLARPISPAVVLLVFDSSPGEQAAAAAAAARADAPSKAFEVLGIGALSRRDFVAAEALFARAETGAGERAPVVAEWRALAARLSAGGAPAAD